MLKLIKNTFFNDEYIYFLMTENIFAKNLNGKHCVNIFQNFLTGKITLS